MSEPHTEPDSPLNIRRTELLDRVMEELSDEFDSVVLLVSDFNGKGSSTYAGWRTRGNCYAANGMVREYMLRQERNIGESDED